MIIDVDIHNACCYVIHNARNRPKKKGQKFKVQHAWAVNESPQNWQWIAWQHVLGCVGPNYNDYMCLYIKLYVYTMNNYEELASTPFTSLIASTRRKIIFCCIQCNSVVPRCYINIVRGSMSLLLSNVAMALEWISSKFVCMQNITSYTSWHEKAAGNFSHKEPVILSFDGFIFVRLN